MNVIGYAAIGVGGFAIVISFVFWYLNSTKGAGKKYLFLLYDRLSSRVKVIEGKIRVDASNKSKKVFAFEGNDTTLPIRPPTLSIGKNSYREITIGQKGELVYLEGRKINDDNYLATSMSGEDVAVFTGMILENNREFENPLAKTTATMIIAMAFIAFLIIVGCVYSTITLVSNSKTMVEAAKENSKAVSGLVSAADTMNSIAEQLTQVAAALTGDLNLTRTIT